MLLASGGKGERLRIYSRACLPTVRGHAVTYVTVPAWCWVALLEAKVSVCGFIRGRVCQPSGVNFDCGRLRVEAAGALRQSYLFAL
jgi:hypothetical protein